MRCDRGGENVDVAQAMLEARGTGQHRVLVGSSVHNQRIERLWRDVFRCVCPYFYLLFYSMEDSGVLNPIDEADLFALHYVYIPRINACIKQFIDAWNHHTTPSMSSRHSPSLSCLLSFLYHPYMLSFL